MEKLAPAFIGLMGTFIGACVVALGWLISHKLTIERETAAKRRDQHLTYLVPAYQALAKLIPYNNAGRLDEIDEELQKAIANIQFFGNAQQIQLVRDFTDNLVRKNIINADPLLLSLRDELRRELGKESVVGPIRWMSLYDKNYNPRAPNN
jgi:hypothetical protein